MVLTKVVTSNPQALSSYKSHSSHGHLSGAVEMLPPLNLGSPDLQGGNNLSSHFVTADASTLLKGAQASVSREEFLQALSHVLGQLDILWKHVQRLEKEVGGGGSSGKPSTPMPTAGGSSTGASGLQTTHIPDMAPPPSRGSVSGSSVGNNESAAVSTPSSNFHPSVVGGFIGAGAAGIGRSAFNSSYYSAPDTLPELRAEDVRSLGGGGGIGGNSDVGLELRKGGFGHSPPPHAVSHLVNAHLLPPHVGSGANNFSLAGLSHSNHDELSAGVPLTISTSNPQQQQQQQSSTRAFLTSSSTSGLHLAVSHSSASATPSLLYVGGSGAAIGGNGNRVMNLSTEQESAHDYISANLPNLSPISSRSSKTSKDGASGPMFGGDILPMTTDVRGISLWSADKSDPNIFPISPEPISRPIANSKSDRRGVSLASYCAAPASCSGGGAGVLNNLQLHDNDSILLPHSSSDAAGTNSMQHHGNIGVNDGSSSASSSQNLHHVVASSNLFSDQNDAVDLHGAATTTPHSSTSTSAALLSLQTQIDCIASDGAAPVSSQIVALPASSSSPFTFSTAGNQQLTPTTSSTSLKNLPQLVDNSRRTLQLYPTSPLPDDDDLLNTGQRHNSSVSQPFSHHFALGGNSHFLTLSDLDAAVSAGSASVLLVSGNHHHSGGSGDGHPQTEAISPILPRGTLDTWVTMAPPQSSSSSGLGNNAVSSQLADSFVPADMFVSATAGNMGVSVPPGSCVCILCGHFVPQNQLEKHQCNGGGPATGLFGSGSGLTTGSGGTGSVGGNIGGGTGSNGRVNNARAQSPLVPMNQGMLAPTLTTQPAPMQTTPISPSESPAAEGPPIAFHGRDVSAHLLQSIGDYIPSSPPGSQAEHSSSGVIGLNMVATGGVGSGSFCSSSPPGTPLSQQQPQQQVQQQILTTRVSGGVSVTKMEPVFSAHSPPLPDSMGSYQFSTCSMSKSSSATSSSLMLPLKRSTDRLLQIESVTLTDGQLMQHSAQQQQEEEITLPPPQRLDEQMALSPISVASSAGGNCNGSQGKKPATPHICNLCGKRFSKKWNLQLHQLTHSGKKPYVCRFCSKAFSRTNILKKHESTLHPNECSLHASTSVSPGTVSLPQPPPAVVSNEVSSTANGRTPSKSKQNRPKVHPPQLPPLSVDPSFSSAERPAPLLLRPVSPRQTHPPTTPVEAKTVNHAIDVKKLKLLTQNLNNVTAITSTSAPTTTSTMTTTINDHGNIFRDTIFKDVILKKDNVFKETQAIPITSAPKISLSHRPSIKGVVAEKRSHDGNVINSKQAPPHVLGGTLLLNTIPASVVVSSSSPPDVKASSIASSSTILGQPPAKRVLQQIQQQEKVHKLQLHQPSEKLHEFSQPPQLVLKANTSGHSSIEISNQPLNLEKLNTSFMSAKSFPPSTSITAATTLTTSQTPMLTISNSDPNEVPLKNLSTDFFYLKAADEVPNSSLLSSFKAPTNDPPPPSLQSLPLTSSHHQQFQPQQSHLQQQQLVLDASSRSFLLESPRILSFNVAAANANAAPTPNVESATSVEAMIKTEINAAKPAKNAVSVKRKDGASTASETSETANNAKKYSCVECGKRFAWEKNLKVHLRSHTNEPKPYGCEFCSKRFTRRQHAKHHLMLQHAAEAAKAGLVITSSSSSSLTPISISTTTSLPPDKRSSEQMLAQAETQRLVANIQRTNVFGCPVCRRAFSQRSEMELHLTTHSNPKPHVCGICGKAFARKDNLKEHRLCVHPTATMTVIGATAADAASSVDDDGANPMNDESSSWRQNPTSLSQEDATSGSNLEVSHSPATPMSLAVSQPLTSMRPVAS